MVSAGSEQESDLIRRAQSGDGEAFQILLHRYLPIIHAYAARMMDNQSDAADIAQEVFIRFWQKAGTFRPEKASLSTWLHQIAHNLCIDFFRKNSKQQLVEDQDLEEPHTTNTIIDERQEQLKIAIAGLPERQRSALLFCHYQGLSNKQAAEILNVSVDALESLLSRARRSLKTKLANNENNNE